MLKNCPKCGIDAVPYDRKTKLSEIVWCNNCGKTFVFRQFRKKRPKLKK